MRVAHSELGVVMQWHPKPCRQETYTGRRDLIYGSYCNLQLQLVPMSADRCSKPVPEVLGYESLNFGVVNMWWKFGGKSSVDLSQAK